MASKGKIVFGVVVSLVVVVAVVAFIALQIVNTRAESEITQNIDQAIQSSGMADSISYQSVDVAAARGTVTVNGVSLTSPDQATRIEASRIEIQVPAGEAAALARDMSTATVSEVRIEASALNVDAPTEGIGFRADTATLDISGTLSQRLQSGPAAILSDIDEIAFSAGGMVIEPNELMLAQMQMQGATWAADEDNRRIDRIAVTVALSPDTIELSEIEFESPLLTATGAGVVGLSETLEPMPQSLTYTISEIDPELRRQVTMFASMFGLAVPAEGGFTLTYAVGPDGYPSFTIE